MQDIKQSFFHVTLLIASVLCLATIILLLAGAPPVDAFKHLFLGSLGSWIKFTQVLTAWIPLTLCACGLVYTFRIGLWNIGIEGQVVAGAISATAVLRMGVTSGTPELFLVLAFVGGMLGGGLWAVFAGFLKTKGGVNEIFAGLGFRHSAILHLAFHRSVENSPNPSYLGQIDPIALNLEALWIPDGLLVVFAFEVGVLGSTFKKVDVGTLQISQIFLQYLGISITKPGSNLLEFGERPVRIGVCQSLAGFPICLSAQVKCPVVDKSTVPKLNCQSFLLFRIRIDAIAKAFANQHLLSFLVCNVALNSLHSDCASSRNEFASSPETRQPSFHPRKFFPNRVRRVALDLSDNLVNTR